jgi:hypothetical protein
VIFLIEYDRRTGAVSLRSFEDSQRRQAQDAKLELELDLHRRAVEREVVLLEAESEEVLRNAYRRYFEDLPTLARNSAEEIRSRTSVAIKIRSKTYQRLLSLEGRMQFPKTGPLTHDLVMERALAALEKEIGVRVAV